MKKKNNLCVMTLTYNRPDYIERSFESLYKRAGIPFTHLVFDDGSNLETRKKLRELKKKYKFKLFLNNKRKDINLYKRFHFSYLKIPKKYEYYVKFDSDTEILTDNFFPHLLGIFSYPSEKISLITPRVEGVINFDRYNTKVDFYNSHSIKVSPLILAGCCMIFTKEVFESLPRYEEQQILALTEEWGIDAMLLNHSLKYGNSVIADDISVYHIDNAHGQRRRYPEYFTNRKRWIRIDNDQVWFIIASKEIYPNFIERTDYERILKKSNSYDNFILNCKNFLKTKSFPTEEKEEEDTLIKENFIFSKNNDIINQMPKETMYKITSPLNFNPCVQIPHGESRYFKEMPDWSKNNPSVVIEKTEVYISPTKSKTIQIKAEEKGKMIRKCKECNYETDSLKKLKNHINKKHSIKKGLKK